MAPRMCAPDPLPVSLSNGGAQCPADFQRVGRSFASAQDDTGWPMRLSSPDALMVQSVGINGFYNK